ncbi:MAG: FimB/Mfa2 family fimbrial subunit [Tannerellaceae bacterium]|jgi:hypothetical protein|nr:FimB/Mfa2 family fimbrial subunit [Tannerellaceae bacterium]
MNNNKWILIVVLIPFLLMGCVADDLSICGVNLRFAYTKNVDGIDKLATEINKVNLYVFKLRDDKKGTPADPTGNEYYFLLSDSIVGNPAQVTYERQFRLEPGYYKFVVWGNLGNDYIRSVLKKDSTKIDDLAISLKYPSSNVIEHIPSDLYHGIETVKLSSADLSINKTVTVDMMKNTKHLIVKATGLAVNASDPTSVDDYKYSISSKNSAYTFANTVTGNVLLRYELPEAEVSLEEETLISKFVIMREVKDGTRNSSILHITRANTASGLPPLPDVDLLPLLIAYNQAKGNQDGQDMLDLRDTYELTLIYNETTGTVSFQIDDWNSVDVPATGGGGNSW